MSPNTFQNFFDQHAPEYESNVFTKNTDFEVDFIIRELGLEKGDRLLDIGCGTGRHAVRLAGRGLQVTGLDLSKGMLFEAEKAADAAGVSIRFIQADAARFSLKPQFDAVICLCEGAFGLLGTDDDDPIEQPLSILKNAAGAGKPGCKYLFTVLNGFKMIRADVKGEGQNTKFDPVLMTEEGELQPRKDSPPVKTRERGFIPTELRLLFASAGLTVKNIWGGTAGAWNKGPLDPDEFEIMVVAEKLKA